ncbi:acyl-CoA dehydrogenase family protein [Streptomyces sp. YIM 98790]|uniref:acyl-CoA dehydrogenase family protein n=1 Tax=Streptomyces sp. YIM 98790 TaxID=2689077 RepID=UPI0014085C97|nr:acyl-CoA dehydrogenase family protein [Streptomyces sp. YIM 98790]
MTTLLHRAERTARQEGLAAGLAAALSALSERPALSGRGAAAAAPGPWAALPAPDVPPGARVRTHPLADREEIAFVACPGPRPAGTPEQAEAARLIAAVRLGIVRRLLDEAVEHLSERTAGDEPLIRKQLITGAVADIIAEVELLREHALTGDDDPEALADLHNRLDDLGWQVAKLFGASGYIADHPARALYVSALVANVWTDRQQGGQAA